MTLSSLFRSALVGLTVLLVLAAPATAQTNELEQARLKGLTEVRILIENLNDTDTRCGISQGQLNAAVTKALLDNGIRISISDDTNVWLYLSTAAMAKPATRARHANTLQHTVGHFQQTLDQVSRRELASVIEDYRQGLIPLIVPLTLIRHHARRLDVSYLLGQRYLDPELKELMLRNHV